VPTILFGLGAIGVARNPEGVVLNNGRQLRALLARLVSGGKVPDEVPETEPLVPGQLGTSDTRFKAKAAG
jgi:branched-chain amino acid transport system permease protein